MTPPVSDAVQHSPVSAPEPKAQPLSRIDEARAHARSVVEASGTSFGPGMRILSKERREAMFAVYAYCREIDDIADEEGTRDEKIDALKEWYVEIDQIYQGNPSKLTGIALAEAIVRFNLPKEEFTLLLEGMEMDASGPIQGPSMEDYLAYCRRVAGAVGMLSMRIFRAGGGEHEDRFAIALANALQTTNILRDVAEDAEIDRLYLPREILVRHGIKTVVPAEVLQHPNTKSACAELGEQARTYFQEARECLQYFDWRLARPALLMMGVYERYWRALRDADWDPTRPVKLTKLQKLMSAARYMLAPPLQDKTT